MIGMKEICALLLAGGMGAGSVVTVQKIRPAVSKPRAKPAVPKAHKTASRNVTNAQILDCPTPALAMGGALPELAAIPTFGTTLPGTSEVAGWPGGGGVLIPPVIGGGGGGGGGGGSSGPDIGPNPEPVPGVPQPASWAMMLTGFGLVGLALRMGSDTAPATEDQRQA